MCKKMICLVSFVLMFGLVSSTSALTVTTWTNADGNDSLWSNANNWSNGVPGTDGDARLTSTLTGPTIDSSTNAVCSRTLGPGYSGNMTMNINGGSFTAGGQCWSIGQYNGNGIANVSNDANVSISGDLYVGNQGNGTLNVNGNSTIDVNNWLRVSNASASDFGRINLVSGTITCEDITGNSTNEIRIDIYEGTLIVRNKTGSSMQSWVDNGYIVGYGGDGTVIVDHNDTTGWDKLTAVHGDCLYDLISNASSASWQTGAGNIEFNGSSGDSNGVVKLSTGSLEDGNSYTNYLFTHPDWKSGVSEHFIEGTYSNISIPEDVNTVIVKFTAKVGYTSASSNSGSDGVTFALLIQRGSEYFELCAVDSEFDGVLTNLSADLTAYKGQTITVILSVDAGATASYDRASWAEAKIVTYGTVAYDFVDNASDANWCNEKQSITFGGSSADPNGCAKYTSCQVENGESYTNSLYTNPDWREDINDSNHYMRGEYEDVAVPSNYTSVKFLARVGLAYDANDSNGIEFAIGVKDGNDPKYLRKCCSSYDERLDYFCVDLSSFKGQTITLYLTTFPGDSTDDDKGVWVEAVMVGYEPEVVYDFAANADEASWRTGAGSIDFNGPTCPNGVAKLSTGNLEDGNSYTNFLYTHPDYGGASEHFIEGTFDNVIIPKNVTDVKFTATVGMSNAGNSNGVMFEVYVSGYGEDSELCSVYEVNDGNLATITANLSAYQGENVSIILYIDPNGSVNYDRAAWVKPRITAELPTQVYVKDKGAVVNDSNDDVSAFREAALQASPAELFFGDGTYNLSDYLMVNCANNINLRGYTYSSGTTKFIIDDPCKPAILIRCSDNISTRDITIDYDPLPFTQGIVSELNAGNKSFKLTIDSGYTELDDPLFSSGGARGRYCDPNTAVRGRPPLDCCCIANITSWTKLSAGVYRVYVTDVNGVSNGVEFTFGKPGNNACDARECGHVLWDNVTLYSSPCIGFVGVNVDRMRLRNCSVKFKEETTRFLSSNFDGVHTRVCKKGPDIIDCLFEGMGDDGVNNGGVGSEILAKQSETRFSVYFDSRPVDVGNYLILFRPSNGKIGNIIKATTIHGMVMVGDCNCHDITVSEAPAGFTVETGSGKDQFFNTDYSGNDYLIKGCTFKNCHANGIRAKAYDGVIKDNTFEGLAARAMQVSNLSIYKEGLQSGNILIKNNTIDHCGFYNSFNQHDYSGVIVIAGQKSGGDPGFGLPADANDLNYDITIEDNEIKNWPRHAIYVSCTDGIKILDNDLTNYNHWTKASSGWRGIMFFDNARDVEVKDNTVVDERPSSQINGKLFIKSMDSNEIDTDNNTYDVNTAAPEVNEVSSY